MKHKIVNKSLPRDVDKESLLTSIEQLSQVMEVMTKVIARIKYQVEQLESEPKEGTSYKQQDQRNQETEQKSEDLKEPLIH